MFVFNLFWYFVYFSFILNWANSYSYFPPQEYLSLYDLYISTNGFGWTWLPSNGNPWNFTFPESNPCDPSYPWQGITCSGSCLNSSCSVTQLFLSGHSLNGTIPFSLNGLTNLSLLSLSQNLLYGTFPLELTTMVQLRHLDLSYNSLRGSIPEELGNLVNLENLILNNNKISGSLPQSISNLLKAQIILMSTNQLVGVIPENLFSIETLQQIQLQYNQLTGTIPNRMENLLNISLISLYSNQLTGTIPNSITQLATLKTINLYSNLLTGSIPSDLSALTNLSYLLVHNNLLTGSIPESICLLHKLMILMVNSNFLTGSIPQSVGNITNMVFFNAYYNSITGTLPSSLGNLTNLENLFIYNTYITGSLPDSLCHSINLRYIMLSTNYLSGFLPSSYSKFPNMLNLIFDTNLFSGTLPASWSNLTQLSTISLFSNQLTGTIPASYSNLTLLVYLYLFENLLTGTLPSEFSHLQCLTSLDLESNLLSGSIPLEYSHIAPLRYIYLSSNRFTGSLPNYLFDSPFIWQIVLFNNYFTGTVPLVFVGSDTLLDLNILDFSYNLLTGELPNSLTYFPFLDYFNGEYNFFTGSLPENLFSMDKQLFYFSISNNYLRDSLPTSFTPNTPLNYLDFSTNIFTGSIVSSSYGNNLARLAYLSVANNFLKGLLPSQLGGDHLKVLYLQNNSFSGSISSDLVANKNITIFMASLNCLTGTIPETFCVNPNLYQLIMDGLHSSHGCVHKLFSFDRKSSYSIINGVHGSIPSCLFNMPSLKVLHLSGNNLHGRLPETINSTHFNSLILSNNLLTGSIPNSLWSNDLIYLDISFNQFSHGDFNYVNTYSRYIDLINNFSLSSNLTLVKPSIRLQVNHLSGVLSPSLSSNVSKLVDINILDGNMFSCDKNRDDLPHQDPNFHTYQCGSQNTNTSLYVTIALVSCLFCFFIYCFGVTYLTQQLKKYNEIIAINSDLLREIEILSNSHVLLSNLQQVLHYLQLLIRWLFLSILWIVFVIMPIYCVLSQYYYTYENQYVWVISSSYLSGVTPALILLFLFLILVGISTYFYFLFHLSLTVPSISWGVLKCSNKSFSFQFSLNSLKLPMILLFETLVVLTVNFAYVLALNHGYDEVTITSITITISIFKLLWSNIVLLGFGRLIVEEYFKLKIPPTITIGMSLFNNVVAPYLAEALVSSNCFYYAITSSPIVNTLYYALQCSPAFVCGSFYMTEISGYSEECTFEVQCENYLETIDQLLVDHQISMTSISYHPPFHYNYTCSSSLLSAFAYVFIYRYLFTGIIEPIIFLLLKYLQSHYNSAIIIKLFNFFSLGKLNTRDKIYRFIAMFLPLLYKFESIQDNSSQHQEANKDIQINPMINNLSKDNSPPSSLHSNELQTQDQIQNISLFKESLLMIKNTLTRIIPLGEKAIVRLITDITVMLSFGVLFPPLGILIFFSLLKDILIEQSLLGRIYHSYLIIHRKENVESEILTLFRDILLLIDSSYQVWTCQFGMGWWWGIFVSVWFWSFSLYDTIARNLGPIQSIWIIFVIGISPYWMTFFFPLFIKVGNIFQAVKDTVKNNSNNSNLNSNERISQIQLEEGELTPRLTELTNQKESFGSNPDIKSSDDLHNTIE